jgi:CheY-like chemotaxis protein
VDDDAVTREGLRSILEREGYRVALTANGNDALHYLEFNPTPSLILLDMLMPLMDGWDFMASLRLRADWSGIPVIITTGMGIASPDWASSMGAAALLKKPYDEKDLLRPIRRLSLARASG